MNQPFIRDQSITVEELIKQAVSNLGENICIRRFVRFVMGEGIEKEESNLADEVAAQTAKMAAEAAAAPAAAPEPTAKPAEDKPKPGKGKKK